MIAWMASVLHIPAPMTQLYASDLDGTLLGANARLSDVSLDILTRLIADGLPFTVASARSVTSIRETLRGLPVRLPVIEFNGAFISELATGKHLHTEVIRPEHAEQIIRLGEKHGMMHAASTFDGTADHVFMLPASCELARWYQEGRRAANDTRLREVNDLRAALEHQIVCLTFTGQRDELEVIRAEVTGLLNGQVQIVSFPEMYLPPWHWLAIYPAKATKAHALAVLAAELGIDLADITVFGDQVNDIPMFTECGRAIAVANAADELRPHADQFIGPNTEDSVARFLETDWRDGS